MRLLQRDGSIGLPVRIGGVLPHRKRTRRRIRAPQRGRRRASGSDERRRGRRRRIHLQFTTHSNIRFYSKDPSPIHWLRPWLHPWPRLPTPLHLLRINIPVRVQFRFPCDPAPFPSSPALRGLRSAQFLFCAFLASNPPPGFHGSAHFLLPLHLPDISPCDPAPFPSSPASRVFSPAPSLDAFLRSLSEFLTRPST